MCVHSHSVPQFCALTPLIAVQCPLLALYWVFLCPRSVLASFSMLCTMQYRFHWVLTLVRPRWFKRVRRLLCRVLPNTGSTVPMR